jgi:hypothetical protein
MKPILRTLIALAVILASLGVAKTATAESTKTAHTKPASVVADQTPAAANAAATNLRYIYLVWPSTLGASACKERVIDIARGWYRWTKHRQNLPYRIYLAKGRYTWRDCVRGTIMDSKWHVYRHDSSLTLHGGGTAVFPHDFYYTGTSGNRWLWFGSTLAKE